MDAVIADLYSGAGGWGVALHHLGLPHTGWDNDPNAVATSRAAGHHTLSADLTHTRPVPCTGIVASPPCQPYSRAGKRQGRDDPRSRHPLTIPLWAGDTHPDWVAIEQVVEATPIFARVAAELGLLGYHVAQYVLHAEQYGVPQTRDRLILMAHRHATPPRPTPTHSRYYPHQPHRYDKNVQRWVSMAQALGWGTPDRPYPTIAAGTASGGADADMVGGSGARAVLDRARNAPTWVRFIAVNDRPNNANRPANHPAPTLAFGHEKPRWVFDRPSTTIVGSFRPDVVAAPNYRTSTARQDQTGSVRVTVAEAGVLQGFPYDYPWTGSRTAQYQQVGNAIPPPLAEAVVRTLTQM